MVQGRGVNASLNAQGRTQAEQVAVRLREVAFDSYYASSLVRTHETLAPMTTDFTPLEGFDEISWGDQEGVKASREELSVYAETIKSWREGDLDLNVGGGESPRQVMRRQKDALAEVLKDAGEKTLICMHGRAIRIMLCWMLNYPLNYMDGFPHQNCGFYGLNYDGENFSVKEFNSISHLSN